MVAKRFKYQVVDKVSGPLRWRERLRRVRDRANLALALALTLTLTLALARWRASLALSTAGDVVAGTQRQRHLVVGSSK